MRHLVYLLLVANAVFLGWNLFESKSADTLVTTPLPLPANVNRLVTLQERQAAVVDDKAVSEIETLTAEQPPGSGAALVCHALGPFAGMDSLRPVSAELHKLGIQAERREVESKELTGFWVYLPAMSSAEASKVRATLDDYNDKEYYVGKGNLVSLGTFRGLERAERRLQAARKMGLEATLEERFTTQTALWLDIQSDGSASGPLKRIAERNSSLQLVDLSCY